MSDFAFRDIYLIIDNRKSGNSVVNKFVKSLNYWRLFSSDLLNKNNNSYTVLINKLKKLIIATLCICKLYKVIFLEY